MEVVIDFSERASGRIQSRL